MIALERPHGYSTVHLAGKIQNPRIQSRILLSSKARKSPNVNNQRKLEESSNWI